MFFIDYFLLKKICKYLDVKSYIKLSLTCKYYLQLFSGARMDKICTWYIEKMNGMGWSDYKEYTSNYYRLLSALRKNPIIRVVYDVIPIIQKYNIENDDQDLYIEFTFTEKQREYIQKWLYNKNIQVGEFLEFNISFDCFEYFDWDDEEDRKNLITFAKQNNMDDYYSIYNFMAYWGFTTCDGDLITPKQLYDLIYDLLQCDNNLTMSILRLIVTPQNEKYNTESIINLLKTVQQIQWKEPINKRDTNIIDLQLSL